MSFTDSINYFAYGSNMSINRLRARVPSAQRLGAYRLYHHDLRFHKIGRDGSGKCDVLFTGHEGHFVMGVLYEIARVEKAVLDAAEDLGIGYGEKRVTLLGDCGHQVEALTYFALQIDASLKPYHWYKQHVVVGAQEAMLPNDYQQRILAIPSIDDPNPERDLQQRKIHR